MLSLSEMGRLEKDQVILWSEEKEIICGRIEFEVPFRYPRKVIWKVRLTLIIVFFSAVLRKWGETLKTTLLKKF